MAYVWLSLKHFQTMWLKVKLVIVVIAIATADFTILSAAQGWNSTLTMILIFTLTMIALSSTLLHMTKHTAYDIGVFKALGASRLTITASILLELVMIGLAGTIAGVLAGMAALIIWSLLAPMSIGLFAPTGFFTVLLLSAILGVLAGAAVGGSFAWRKSRETVSEILSHAK